MIFIILMYLFKYINSSFFFYSKTQCTFEKSKYRKCKNDISNSHETYFVDDELSQF